MPNRIPKNNPAIEGMELINPRKSFSYPRARIKKLKNNCQVLKMMPLMMVASKNNLALCGNVLICCHVLVDVVIAVKFLKFL
jgi:hypothetical protein